MIVIIVGRPANLRRKADCDSDRPGGDPAWVAYCCGTRSRKRRRWAETMLDLWVYVSPEPAELWSRW
jgi:hypothetical protein